MPSMGPPALPRPGAQRPSSPWPTTAVLFLCLLASGSPSVEGCLNCGHQFKNLRVRFAQLCARYRQRFPQRSCSNYPWGGEAVRDFALDEAALDLLLEKAHRVLRVIEIKQSFADVPKFWNWLHEVKIPEETREGVRNHRKLLKAVVRPVDLSACFVVAVLHSPQRPLCPPACQVVASVFNCSTCRRVEIPCWDKRACYPEHPGLPKIIQLLLLISGSCFFLGLVSCALEFWLRPGLGTK